MLPLLYSLSILILFIVVLMYIYTKHLNSKITSFPLYGDFQGLTHKVNNHSLDIIKDLEECFHCNFIASRDRQSFIAHYTELYNETCKIRKVGKIFLLLFGKEILSFVKQYESLTELIKQHNDNYIQNQLVTNRAFFDQCLSYPLDEQQRRSIVSEEDNNLVVSSAGSGKTSSIIGKVKYLTKVLNIAPERILLISYTNKAAAELTDRMSMQGLKGYTFHKLALDIIGSAEGHKPSICDNTDLLFIKIYHRLLENESFKKSVIDYFLYYQVQEEDWEQKKRERREHLAEQKKTKIKVQFPDMDGHVIYVRSEQERKICVALTSLNIKFRYEEPYEYKVDDEMHSQYKPDFSIYYTLNGKTERIYLEHFGIDEHGLVPTWFAFQKGMTYTEANAKYGDGMTWKKELHETRGTTLIYTTSADFTHYDIKKRLMDLFNENNIPYTPKTEEELYSLVLPQKGKQEKAFIRLVSTFITLLKSSCRCMEDVMKEAEDHKDWRSLYIVRNIFSPVYKEYIEELNKSGEIDFTDAIIQATNICNAVHPLKYDYIIVDEFQDISVDRYNFLKSLRNTTPPAKLYCVGDDWQSIYRFSGSDMSLFNEFSKYFGYTEINKIETTYRFGEPLVSLSSSFIQRNHSQIKKQIHPFKSNITTQLMLCAYERKAYCEYILNLVNQIPQEKSIFLLGRYSFDDYYLSFAFQSRKEGPQIFYQIGNRKIEFLTVHKSKGLEADYVILLMCNNDTYGFPSLVNDDFVLNYVLTKSEDFPFAEERRLFYVAITRAKITTFIMYDHRFPSIFVNELLHPEKFQERKSQNQPRNANKIWTKESDKFLLELVNEGKSVKYIANKMGRSQTSISMRIGKLESKKRWLK